MEIVKEALKAIMGGLVLAGAIIIAAESIITVKKNRRHDDGNI